MTPMAPVSCIIASAESVAAAMRLFCVAEPVIVRAPQSRQRHSYAVVAVETPEPHLPRTVLVSMGVTTRPDADPAGAEVIRLLTIDACRRFEARVAAVNPEWAALLRPVLDDAARLASAFREGAYSAPGTASVQ